MHLVRVPTNKSSQPLYHSYEIYLTRFTRLSEKKLNKFKFKIIPSVERNFARNVPESVVPQNSNDRSETCMQIGCSKDFGPFK